MCVCVAAGARGKVCRGGLGEVSCGARAQIFCWVWGMVCFGARGEVSCSSRLSWGGKNCFLKPVYDFLSFVNRDYKLLVFAFQTDRQTNQHTYKQMDNIIL